MKKVFSVIAIVAGVLLLLSAAAPMIAGAILEARSYSVGIIGGADGPTAVFVAGTLGAGSVVVQIVAGVLLLVVGVWGYWKSRVGR